MNSLTPLEKKAFENIVAKGGNAGNQYFFPFPKMFSTLSHVNLNFLIRIILSFANALNLVNCISLSFGKELLLSLKHCDR